MSDLDDDYEKAGFGGKLAFGQKAAFVVVDVVRAYVDPESALYAGVEDALASNVRLIAACREVGVPVVFTRVVYGANGLDGGVFYRKVPALKAYLPDSPLGDFCEGIEPRADEVVVTKQYASAFFGTSLAATLRSIGVDTVILGGFSTSGCVRATALDALQHGFIPFVVREACGDRDDRPHEASLFDLQAKYAEVVSEAEILALIGKGATR